METIKKTTYGLRVKATGELARINRSYNGDERYACGEYSYKLTDWPDDPVFEIEDPDRLVVILAKDTQSYNTDEDLPGWGRFDRDDLQPVKIESTVDIEDIEVKLPYQVDDVYDTRDIPKTVAERYAGQKLPKSDRYVFVLVKSADEDQLRSQVGGLVQFSSYYNKRKLLAVCDVPEDYQDCVEENGALLICTGEVW